MPDDVNVVYLYNPFTRSTFTSVANQIHASVTRNPRVVVLIYHHPVMHDYLAAQGFRVVSRRKGLFTYVAPIGIKTA